MNLTDIVDHVAYINHDIDDGVIAITRAPDHLGERSRGEDMPMCAHPF